MELSLLDVCLVDTAKEFMMLKKLILSAATAASLVLGAGVMTAAPAQAQVHFGFSFGDGYYGYPGDGYYGYPNDGFYGYPGYGDGYYGYPDNYGYYDDGYGWQRHRHWRGPHHVRCEVRKIRHHHQWVQRRVCYPRHNY